MNKKKTGKKKTFIAFLAGILKGMGRVWTFFGGVMLILAVVYGTMVSLGYYFADRPPVNIGGASTSQNNAIFNTFLAGVLMLVALALVIYMFYKINQVMKTVIDYISKKLEIRAFFTEMMLALVLWGLGAAFWAFCTRENLPVVAAVAAIGLTISWLSFCLAGLMMRIKKRRKREKNTGV